MFPQCGWEQIWKKTVKIRHYVFLPNGLGWSSWKCCLYKIHIIEQDLTTSIEQLIHEMVVAYMNWLLSRKQWKSSYLLRRNLIWVLFDYTEILPIAYRPRATYDADTFFVNENSGKEAGMASWFFLQQSCLVRVLQSFFAEGKEKGSTLNSTKTTGRIVFCQHIHSMFWTTKVENRVVICDGISCSHEGKDSRSHLGDSSDRTTWLRLQQRRVIAPAASKRS